MLTVAPPHQRHSDEPLLGLLRRLRRFDWDRFLLGWCAAFHLLTAVTLAIFPRDQVLTEGTRPVLELASRYVWAVVFAAAGVAVAWLLRPRRRAARIPVWAAVLGLGGMWLTAFFLAVLDGRGSALGVVVWPFLYGPWAIVAVRSSSGKR